MSLRCRPLRMFGKADDDRQLPLSRLPEVERRTPCVTAMAVPASALKISGDVKYYEIKADSGNAFSRGFCPECGARLFAKSSGMPRLALITAASLDDPSQFRPAMDFYLQRPALGSYGSRAAQVCQNADVGRALCGSRQSRSLSLCGRRAGENL